MCIYIYIVCVCVYGCRDAANRLQDSRSHTKLCAPTVRFAWHGPPLLVFYLCASTPLRTMVRSVNRTCRTPPFLKTKKGSRRLIKGFQTVIIIIIKKKKKKDRKPPFGSEFGWWSCGFWAFAARPLAANPAFFSMCLSREEIWRRSFKVRQREKDKTTKRKPSSLFFFFVSCHRHFSPLHSPRG